MAARPTERRAPPATQKAGAAAMVGLLPRRPAGCAPERDALTRVSPSGPVMRKRETLEQTPALQHRPYLSRAEKAVAIGRNQDTLACLRVLLDGWLAAIGRSQIMRGRPLVALGMLVVAVGAMAPAGAKAARDKRHHRHASAGSLAVRGKHLVDAQGRTEVLGAATRWAVSRGARAAIARTTATRAFMDDGQRRPRGIQRAGRARGLAPNQSRS